MFVALIRLGTTTSDVLVGVEGAEQTTIPQGSVLLTPEAKTPASISVRYVSKKKITSRKARSERSIRFVESLPRKPLLRSEEAEIKSAYNLCGRDPYLAIYTEPLPPPKKKCEPADEVCFTGADLESLFEE